jgi:hypothetical protein
MILATKWETLALDVTQIGQGLSRALNVLGDN